MHVILQKFVQKNNLRKVEARLKELAPAIREVKRLNHIRQHLIADIKKL